MKTIITDLRSFIQEDFNWKSYSLIIGIVAILCWLSYGYHLETKLYQSSNWTYQVFFPVFYVCLYFVFIWIKSGGQVFKQRDFVFLGIFYVLLIGFNTGFLSYRNWVEELPLYERYFLRNIFANSKGTIIILGGMALIYQIRERNYLPNFYGFSIRGQRLWPYLVLILLMIVPIAWAATQADFLKSYPAFKPWRYQSAFGLSTSTMAWLFELVYLFDFIRVEAIFRGALIIGLARFIGKDSVIAMAALYCVFHFNKPLGETISSFFGGYLLGVIALKHNNIIGGCIVHVGIAAMMDAAAHIARLV